MTHKVILIVEASVWHPPLFHKGLKNAVGINVRWSHSQCPYEKDNFSLGPKPCIWRPLGRAEWKVTVPDSWSLTMVLHTVILAAVLSAVVWSLPIYRAPNQSRCGNTAEESSQEAAQASTLVNKTFSTGAWCVYFEAGLYVNFCGDEGWANFLNCKFNGISKHLTNPPSLHIFLANQKKKCISVLEDLLKLVTEQIQ